MEAKTTVHRMLAALLAIAVSPLCLSAANYYTTAEVSSSKADVYATGNAWADVEGKVSPDAPSSGNNYHVITTVRFKKDGVFGGDSLSLGLPADATAPWAGTPAIFPIGANATYTINDFRLYSGTIYARSENKYDYTIAGTTTVYSAGQVDLQVYRNYSNTGSSIDDHTRRSINLASTLKGEAGTSLNLTLGNQHGQWPVLPVFIILSGDFSEYHGSFSTSGGLLLLNTTSAFGCEADGEDDAVYTVTADAIMAVAADKSTSMSRKRGIKINKTKTLTLTTTNIVDKALSYRGDYSGYTVTFPISSEAYRLTSTTLVKSGEGTVTLDSVCNVGTVRVDVATLALGANFRSPVSTPLVLAAGTQIALADGVCVEFPSVTIEGEAVGYGIYTGTGGPAYATPVAWIAGTGTLLVRPSATPATTVADTWKAEGNAGLMSASTSWVGESSPNLTTGEFLPTFASAGSGAVSDANGLVKGIVFNNASGDFALTGAGMLMVLGGGIDVAEPTDSRTYTIAMPLAAGLSQTWNVGENATLAISGQLEGSRAATVTKTGSGTLDISGTNDYPGALSVTGGRLRLSGVFGCSAESDGALMTSGAATNIFAGATVNKPVTHEVGGADCLTAEAGTTNVFNGRVAYSRNTDFDFYLGDGAVVIYNDGLTVTLDSSKPRKIRFTRDTKVTTSPLVRFCGRPSVMTSNAQNTFTSYVTCRFEVPGNTIDKYMSTATARLEATVDYAWNGTDGIGRYTINGSGSVIDVGSTRQCIQDIAIENYDTKSYYAVVTGEGGTLELAPTNDLTLEFDRMRFEGMVSLQKHGSAALTLTNKTASAYSQSYGDVAVTNGVLEFAAGATWLNGTNVTVSGSGTLKLNAANTFNREHAVIRFADNGAINVPPGVTQVFAEGWDGDKRMRGIYTSYTSSRVTGGGAIQVGPVTGLMIFVR